MDKAPIKAIAVDDEQEPLDLLSGLLGNIPEVWLVSSLTDPEKVLENIRQYEPALLFLDVKMPGKTGFDLLDEIRETEINLPEVIFTTAYDEFAVQAFEYSAIDYLLKPIDPEKLQRSVEKYQERKTDNIRDRSELLLDSLRKLVFRSLTGAIFIDPLEIIYIEAFGNYTIFHFGCENTETVTVNLGQVEKQLDPGMFFRTSRSFIINTKYLKRVHSAGRRVHLEKEGEEFVCEFARDKMMRLINHMKK